MQSLVTRHDADAFADDIPIRTSNEQQRAIGHPSSAKRSCKHSGLQCVVVSWRAQPVATQLLCERLPAALSEQREHLSSPGCFPFQAIQRAQSVRYGSSLSSLFTVAAACFQASCAALVGSWQQLCGFQCPFLATFRLKHKVRFTGASVVQQYALTVVQAVEVLQYASRASGTTDY